MDTITFEREEREEAVERIRTHFERERDEELGNLGATLLFDFIA
jgi:uncharacterized protein (DUF2164 family)